MKHNVALWSSCLPFFALPFPRHAKHTTGAIFKENSSKNNGCTDWEVIKIEKWKPDGVTMAKSL
jgi:hypothetical protein